MKFDFDPKSCSKGSKNDVLKTISSTISQNAPIIWSIISNFWPIIKCDFDPKRCSKGSKNDVLKTISSQIIWKTLRYPISTVLHPRLTLILGYYHRARSWLWNREALLVLISRACSYPIHLLFASYTLKHLYQIMIRS